MVEKVVIDIDEKENVKNAVNNVLKNDTNKFINLYYRAEGTFVLSLISLLLLIFLWDNIQSPLYFFIFNVVFNLILMMYFLFKHLKVKGAL